MSVYDTYLFEILDIIKWNSSSTKKLSQQQIKTLLEENKNILISRGTLSKYLSILRDYDLIEGTRGVRYKSEISPIELRILIDGVLFGHHVSKKEAESLIKKLKKHGGKEIDNKVKHVHYLPGLNHVENTEAYPIFDLIDTAIEEGKRVDIYPSYYDVQGNSVYLDPVCVSPYFLVTDKARYYLICFNHEKNRLENRRLDRISKVIIYEKDLMPIYDIIPNFKLDDYMNQHIYMFSGESIEIDMRINKRNIGDFIDWYGLGYRILELDDDYALIRFNANENAMYYWALQYGGIAEIVRPLSLRSKIKAGIQSILEKYK